MILILLIGIGYCSLGGKTHDGAALIPREAALVMAIDLPQMVGKVNFEILKRSEKLQVDLAEAAVENPVLAEIVRDPAEAGIDFYQPAFAAYIKNPYRPEEDFSAIIVKLKDKNAFEKVINRSTLQEKKKNDRFTSVQIDRLTQVGWNNSFAIMGASDLLLDLDEMLDRFFSLRSEESVLSEPSFQQAISQKGDFLFWVSTTGLMADEKLLNNYGLKGLPAEFISGNYIIGNLRFTKGKMSGLANFLFKPEVEARFDNFFTDKFNADFSTFIADEGRQGTFLFSLNLPGIYHYSISDADIRNGLESWLANNGVEIDDLLRLFGGDFAIVNYERDGIGKTGSVLATNIYRPDLLQRYLDIMVQSELILPVREGLYATKLKQSVSDTTKAPPAQDPLSYHLIAQDDKLFFTDDPLIIEAVMKGGYAPQLQMKENANALMAGNFFHGQVLFDEKTNAAGDLDPFESLVFKLSKKQLDFTVTLKDKSASALETILQGGFQ